ncbi:MAG: hypothetical protein WC747_03420 [Candidatus Babeliales bacterium]
MKKLNQYALFFFALSFLTIGKMQCSVMQCSATSITDNQIIKPVPIPKLLSDPNGKIYEVIWWNELMLCIKQCEMQEKETLLNTTFKKFLKLEYEKLLQNQRAIANNPKLNQQEKEEQEQIYINAAYKKVSQYRLLLGNFFTETLSPNEIIYPASLDLEEMYHGDAKMSRIERKAPQTMVPTTSNPVNASAPIVIDHSDDSEKPGILTELLDIFVYGTIIPSSVFQF